MPTQPETIDVKTTAHKYFHALCINPDIKFEGQYEDENVYLTLRAHPLTFLPWIVSVLLSIVTLTVAVGFLAAYISIADILFILIVGYTFAFSYVFYNILKWVFNVGIVTDFRVVDLDYRDILIKDFSATTMSDVSEISSNIAGFIPSLFRYGNIVVQTPGPNINIEFHNVPEPDTVVSIVNQLMEPIMESSHE